MNNGPTVLLPNNSTMKATHVGTLSMSSLLTKEIMSCALPTATKLLLSAWDVCDEGGEAIFMKKEVNVTHKGAIF